MTDKHTTKENMDINEYVEQSYKGAPLNSKLFARIPSRLSVWIETFALTKAVSTSDITRHALERYASANGYDPQHKL